MKTIFQLFSLLIICVCILSCGSSKKDVKSDGSSSIKIGDIYEGGIVFYLDGTGKHGLVAATKDQGEFVWSTNDCIIGTTKTEVGMGQVNTTAIIKSCKEAVAAKICDDLTLDGYSDWYLPSRDELSQMYSNLMCNHIGGFSFNYYLCSSEDINKNLWVLNFRNGERISGADKKVAYSLRAIRTF